MFFDTNKHLKLKNKVDKTCYYNKKKKNRRARKKKESTKMCSDVIEMNTIQTTT